LSENDSVSTYFNESEIDTATAGQLNNIIISRLGEEDGATGNGTLASIYFNATGSGMAFVRITSALLSNNTGGAISSTIQNTTVNISGEGGGGGGDTTAPNVTINSISTAAGSNIISFNTTASDETALGACFYSILNSTSGTEKANTTFTCNSNPQAATVSAFGSYTMYFYANDTSGNLNSTTLGFTTSATASATVTGGGGGGGAVTVNETKIIENASPDAAVLFTDFHPDTAIKEIEVWVNEVSSNLQITALRYDGVPAEISVEKEGKVYRYLQITAGENLGDNLKNATITFKVEKSWLGDNNLDENDVSLFRFNSGRWGKLSTTILNSDDAYAYYKIRVTSFSYFAIAEKTGIIAQVANVNIWLLLIIVVIIAIIITLIIVLYRRGKKSSLG